MLNKLIYETGKHKIEIIRNNQEWLLQVFEGVGAKVVDYKTFKSCKAAMRYVVGKYIERIDY